MCPPMDGTSVRIRRSRSKTPIFGIASSSRRGGRRIGGLVKLLRCPCGDDIPIAPHTSLSYVVLSILVRTFLTSAQETFPAIHLHSSLLTTNNMHECQLLFSWLQLRISRTWGSSADTVRPGWRFTSSSITEAQGQSRSEWMRDRNAPCHLVLFFVHNNAVI